MHCLCAKRDGKCMDVLKEMEVKSRYGSVYLHPDARPARGADAGERRVKGSLDAAERIVALCGREFDRDGNARHAGCGEPSGSCIVDKRGVRPHDRFQPRVAGVCGDFEQLGA